MKRQESKGLDITKYIGEKTKIAYAEVVNMQYGLCLKAVTEPIPFKEGDELPEGKELRASKLISFAEQEGNLVIITGSKGDQWLQGKGVTDDELEKLTPKEGETLTCLSGKKVTVQKKGETNFLEIA